jgi:SAM-dependent methyltransferase
VTLKAMKTRADESCFRSTDYARLPKQAVACACCGGADVLPAARGDRYFFGLETVACRACGLIFTSPRPDDAWFEEFYRLHYRRFYESMPAPDATYVLRDAIQLRHHHTLSLLAPHLADRGTLLDIGCAEGTFLHLFGQRFPQWELQGVEPSESFSAFAREHYGLSGVRTGHLKTIEDGCDSSLDLIVASHLLEHVLDPNAFFRTAHRLLRNDGLLSIEVPDAEGQKRGIQNLHIAHVYHFSERTLGHFLAKHGFARVWSRKGVEKPHPWTLHVLARKEGAPPDDWSPPSADADEVARAFARLCRSSAGSILLRRWKHLRRERMPRSSWLGA